MLPSPGMMQPLLVTGTAGFIGFHLATRLLAEGWTVIGVDCLLEEALDLRQARLKQLQLHPNYTHLFLDLTEAEAVAALFQNYRFAGVLHLAARTGVRRSSEVPALYLQANINAFGHLLEGCRNSGVPHVVFASSSSVYGERGHEPFSEAHPTDHPRSIYAASKRADELLAHSYASLYGLPCTGLRFFTVYGPWGRPDMAVFKFTAAILGNQPVPLYDHGLGLRDWTYVGDVVEALIRVLKHPPQAEQADRPDRSNVPYRIFNVGNQQPVQVRAIVDAIEQATGCTAQRDYLPAQAGDVSNTWADTHALRAAIAWAPATPLSVGIRAFVEWYREFYGSAG